MPRNRCSLFRSAPSACLEASNAGAAVPPIAGVTYGPNRPRLWNECGVVRSRGEGEEEEACGGGGANRPARGGAGDGEGAAGGRGRWLLGRGGGVGCGGGGRARRWVVPGQHDRIAPHEPLLFQVC